MDAGAISHPEFNKYQDSEASYDPEGPQDLDAYAIFLPGVSEDNEVPVLGSVYNWNTQKTPYYVRTMDLDVANIDKSYKIHGGKYTRQLTNLTL